MDGHEVRSCREAIVGSLDNDTRDWKCTADLACSKLGTSGELYILNSSLFTCITSYNVRTMTCPESWRPRSHPSGIISKDPQCSLRCYT